MKKYDPVEITALLSEVDRQLSEPATIVLIGGVAAALGYGVANATRDIDTWTPIDGDLARAFAEAKRMTRLMIPVERPGVAEAPWEFESRLQTVELVGLTKLTVLVPEKHDLVLSKLSRGDERDIEAIVAIRDRVGLDFDVLVDRYTGEMGHASGDPARLDLRFAYAIERLFGEDRATEAERRLKEWRASGSPLPVGAMGAGAISF